MRNDMLPGLSVTWAKPLTFLDKKRYGITGTHVGGIKVEAGLCKHGEQTPRFSVTGEVYRRAFGRRDFLSGGCIHDEVVKYWPKLAPIIALHLSTEDGVPMHAEGNGWYWLVAYYGGLGEQYHGGTSKQNFPITPDPATPWKNTEHREPTPDECLGIFAEHVRLSLDDARIVAARVMGAFSLDELRQLHPAIPGSGDHGYPDIRDLTKTLRLCWNAECAKMIPRWNAEATAAIELLKTWSAEQAKRAAEQAKVTA